MTASAMKTKVVVTGAGVISPLGAGIDEFEQNLYAGQSALKPSAQFDGMTTAEVADFQPQTWLGNKGVRVLDRTARLLCVATHMALCHAGVASPAPPGEGSELGLVYGTMFGSMRSITSFDWTSVTEGPSYVSPMEFPNTVISSPGGQAAIKYGLRGVNSTICAGSAAALHALNCAAEFIRFGRARAVLAGGAEELCQEALHSFGYRGLLSPSGAARPFAQERDGTALGEGSALWMLEDEDRAAARGRIPLLEVCGFGEAQDDAPTAECAAAAMRQAIKNSAIGPEQIACVIAGASGSPSVDEAEERALLAVFGPRLREIPICAPKAALGEAMGASGAYCALVAGLALIRQSVPPTANHDDQSSGPLALSSQAKEIRGEYALVNAFSHDGNATSLVLRRPT
jgi:3-oxoacyl-[acyl-carrier-protein] synthase II